MTKLSVYGHQMKNGPDYAVGIHEAKLQSTLKKMKASKVLPFSWKQSTLIFFLLSSPSNEKEKKKKTTKLCSQTGKQILAHFLIQDPSVSLSFEIKRAVIFYWYN